MNCKRKSRRRFYSLVRSRTPPISSEFRGGGVWTPQTPPPLGTPLLHNENCKLWVVKWSLFCFVNSRTLSRGTASGARESNQSSKWVLIHDFDELQSVWSAWLCSPREDSHLYSPGGSVVVSRQANLVQGHTAHVMSPLTWRDRTIRDSSLSFLISYSGSVFTKCWTTTPNTMIQNILLQTCIQNVPSSNLVWSATVHLLYTPSYNSTISNLQWLLKSCVRFFIPFHSRHLTCPYLSYVMCCPPPCMFFILFARDNALN